MSSPSDTTSDIVTVKHTFTIDHFSFHVNADGKFKRLCSAPFAPLDCDGPSFYLSLYPDGYTEETKDFVSVFLWCLNPGGDIPVTCLMSVIDQNGDSRNFRKITTIFSVKMTNCGLPKFIERSFLFNPECGLLPNDQLKLHCKIDATYKPRMTSIRSRCPLSLDQFSLNLESLLESGDHSDVTICIGDTEFTAHKAILSAVSPVFAAMFAHAETKEAQEGEVTIEDVDVDTFDVMLQCIYSGHNPDKEQLTEELLVLSDKYQVAHLKSVCEEHLSSGLSFESAASLLLLADTHSAENLKANSLHFITANVTKVLATEDWKAMMKARPQLAEELIRQLALKTSQITKSIGPPSKKRRV